jgi:hypothetical protein
MNMRNPWLLLVLTILTLAATQLLLPWWSLAGGAFLLGAVGTRRGGQAFGVGFGGAALSWLLPALWLSARNDGLLARRVAGLLPLGGSVPALLLATAVVAGLVGGLAMLAGCWLRQAIRPTPELQKPLPSTHDSVRVAAGATLRD